MEEPDEIPNVATNACAFVCLLICDHFHGDKDSPWSEDCWRKTTASVEDIIVSSRGIFNYLRDQSKFYKILEAKQLLRKDGLIRTYTLTEEIVDNEGVYSMQVGVH